VREIFLRRGAGIIRALTPEQREEFRKLTAERFARGKAAKP
jgi:Spy/CpxP family protein refolding chaperone